MSRRSADDFVFQVAVGVAVLLVVQWMTKPKVTVSVAPVRELPR